MRGPIVSKRRSQPLCQEGTLQTNLIRLSMPFSVPSPACSPCTNLRLLSAEWVFGGVVKVRAKTPKWGVSLGLWPLIGPWPSPAAESHRDGAVATNWKGPGTAEKLTTSWLLPRSDKRRVVQRWRETMGQFERRRWGQLNPHHKHLIVKACFVK